MEDFSEIFNEATIKVIKRELPSGNQVPVNPKGNTGASRLEIKGDSNARVVRNKTNNGFDVKLATPLDKAVKLQGGEKSALTQKLSNPDDPLHIRILGMRKKLRDRNNIARKRQNGYNG